MECARRIGRTTDRTYRESVRVLYLEAGPEVGVGRRLPVLTDQEIRSKVHAAIQALGLPEVSRRLGVKPDTLARLACGSAVKRGTFALVGQALPLLEATRGAPLALCSMPPAGDLVA